MEAVLIDPKTEDQQKQLDEFLQKSGLENRTVTLSEKQYKYFAGLKMIEIADKHPKFDVSYEEIEEMGKEIDEEVYARFKP